jgi:hypothetical protein
MPEMNRSFFAERAAQALKVAQTTKDPEVAATHRRLATSYRELMDLSPRANFRVAKTPTPAAREALER